MDPRILFLLGWGALNGGLATVVGSEVGWGEQVRLAMPEPETTEVAPVESTVLPAHSLPKLENKFRQTLERPLFVPSRRPAPPPPPPPPPPKPTMKKGQFQLLGTATLPDEGYAILREIEGGKIRQVQVGRQINGILLSKVEAEGVTLEQYDEKETLRLKVQPSPLGVPAAAEGKGAAAPGQIAQRLRQKARDKSTRSNPEQENEPKVSDPKANLPAEPGSAPEAETKPKVTRFGP